jgi:hypothetical protein
MDAFAGVNCRTSDVEIREQIGKSASPAPMGVDDLSKSPFSMAKPAVLREDGDAAPNCRYNALDDVRIIAGDPLYVSPR